MLKTDNKCFFSITRAYAGCNPGSGYYGFIVDFNYDNQCTYQGVLAPNMIRNQEWVLFPMDCVEITKSPNEPVRHPAYEIDE